MKAKALETIFKVWTIGVALIAVTGVLIAVYHLAIGDISATASFEF